ncbi:phospholipase D-like domain-containing protein [Pelagerythrobacter rhizovicinus]|uniref:Phospholipase D n=1 Tax=Pelagerythrobacter rhizovicinus TaxID=2268576 RepID=A0A4Q2KJE3_9SPHN|nr:phosphatidylserine/phosphatidylglycerophosphate/cardiolipin synthase family protein [Pelagerythrobacter rhizovicinus]RXZ64479.1 phosphatidylserine/phosphatidylglycerophosphate/cardiolipin synthase family protein [Pelagerythrobacter rhizovicinus]
MAGTQTSGDIADRTAFTDPSSFSIHAGGQDLTFYPAGTDRREALFAMVRAAKRSLKLCFYIYAEDEVGTALRDALVEAVGRGVSVTLILDGFGAAAGDEFLAPLRAAGGTIYRFSPRWTQRYLIRNHQKIVIADDECGMIGGFNIEDSYFAPPDEDGWNDLAIRIEGSAVTGLAHWFARLSDWCDVDDHKFRSIRRAVRSWDWAEGGARWLVGGPTNGLSTWARCVSEDLLEGQRLDMLMAYFSPPTRLQRRIGRIAAKGQTRLVMASKSDNPATVGATRSLYSYLLRKGARVWEFKPCKLHTKLIVLDDVVYLGSANFDMRSLYLNLELMLQIEDAALADRMREYISHHIEASEAITPALHRKRATLWNRVRWNLGWLLVSVIDYTVTRRLNLGL